MATTAAAIDQAANPKSVDESLWWDSFLDLFNNIQTSSLSEQPLPPSLLKELKNTHIWFLETVSLFKPPNQKSKSALGSNQLNVGSSWKLSVEADLKDLALQVSQIAGLDEVQSYILVKRFIEREGDVNDENCIHLILLQYYTERQCLLKCTRQIIMHSLYVGNESGETDCISEEAAKLISDGLDRKLGSVLRDLLLSSHSRNIEVDVATLWAEETLIEVNLVLDILFLVYNESLCTCNSGQWRSFCSLYKDMLSKSFKFHGLAISFEARGFLYHSKIQLLLILVETLDLESLLQMVHDEVPFMQGHSAFNLSDIQEMDAMISTFSYVDTEEAGPLILAWAVFICLISSLPEKQDPSMLVDIDHVGYVRQAFKSEALSTILEILGSEILKDSDAPIAGYRSVLRTLISAFIASYEITQQSDDGTLSLVLDIVCNIYRGEESLCIQFWDRGSFIDGPIRSLLSMLEIDFPYRVMEFVCLLSALCEGTWPAECVYNFLDRSVGISSLFEVSWDISAEMISQTIETPQALYVPEIENLLIPSKTRGRVVKIFDKNTCLVRWEYVQSGIFVLLLRLARQLYLNHYEETHFILDLLSRLVSSNKTVCSSLMDFDNSLSVERARKNGYVERGMRIDVVEIICGLVRNLSPDVRSVAVMSTSVNILAKLFKCSPSHVSEMVLKKNIFDVAVKNYNFAVSPNENGMWMLSGGLARMLSIDCEQTEECCSLTLSVLEFTKQLVETGAEDDISMALVVFSLQYILVNHELWKYRVKHARWKVTLKVLELMKICIKLIPTSQKLTGIVRDILLCDSSVHNTLCRIMCITSQTLEKLHVSRLYETKEIEGLQMAVGSVLDVVFTMLTAFPKNTLISLPVFHQAMLSSMTQPIPVITAVVSLVSYSCDPEIQVGAVNVLSALCIVAENTHPSLFGNASFVSDDKQITDLRYSIYGVLCYETPTNKDLLVATLKLLTSAASHQPAFLISVISPKENVDVPLTNADGNKQKTAEVSSHSLKFKIINIVDALLQYVKRSEDLLESDPQILLLVLIFLKVLWQGNVRYLEIMELFKASDIFWKSLSTILEVARYKDPHNLPGNDSPGLGYKYQCCSTVLEIMANDLFLEKKLLKAESSGKRTEKSKGASPVDVQNVLLAWCESSTMENLVNSYATCEYDSEMLLRSSIASGMFLAHVMGKLISGGPGSLSLSFLKKIEVISKKLASQPAFSELLAQYSQRDYSGAKELNALILSNLFSHLQGELEGPKMNSGPYKELAQFLLQLKFCQGDSKDRSAFPEHAGDAYVFDLLCMQKDLGLEYWDHTMWQASKAVAEKMFLYMQDANMMLFLSNSKCGALKALTGILSVFGGNLIETKTSSMGKGISGTFLSSSIEGVCKHLQATVESIVPTVDPAVDITNFLEAQVELLLCLIRLLRKCFSEKSNMQLALHVCRLVLKTSGTSLRVMCSFIPSMSGIGAIMKLFLLALLLSIEFWQSNSSVHHEKQDKESVEGFAEVSRLSLGLLPILCSCAEIGECCNLSLVTMDSILNGFLASGTWLPVIQKHLQVQLLIQKLRERDSFPSVSIVLKFLLTLARVRGGAEMLQTANFFASLKVLISLLLDQNLPIDVQDERGPAVGTGEDEKRQYVWGLGLTVVTAMISSLGNSSLCIDFVDSVIPYFFSEKAYIIFHQLDLPDLPSEDHGKKRARTQKTRTSLTSLREIEHTLMLVCVLAKHRKSWFKSMKEMNSQLRERSIHLLAFISRGAQRTAESSSRTALVCPPTLQEEVELHRRPSFVNCKHGWFSLLPFGCMSRPYTPAASSTALVPQIKDQPASITDIGSHTHFSDVVTVQIYRIAFLLLKFLCQQAEEATNRAEEMGFINLAHFPELPMPEILHGLQDQAISIVGELCADKSKSLQPEIQDICLLLLQIMEKSLYLEFCVAQSCGIRPVLGRVEDFSKDFKMLMQVAEEHTFLKASLKSLRQIVSSVYPGLLRTEGYLL